MDRKIQLAAAICAITLFAVPSMASQKDFIELCRTGTFAELELASKDIGNSPTKAVGGVTPLMAAAASRGDVASVEKIKFLLASGAVPNVTDRDGKTALMYAAQFSDKPEVVRELLAAGADRDTKDKRGWNALSYAAAKNPTVAMTETLIDAGAVIESGDKEGVTPLMLAFRGGAPKDVIETLLAAGADPSARDKVGRAAPDYAKRHPLKDDEALAGELKETAHVRPAAPARFARAARHGNPERLKAMLEAGTDPNAAVDGLTPLMWAAKDNPEPNAIAGLAEAGADLDARDPEGRTALMHAAGNAPAFKALVAAGARTDIADKNGRTALDYAVEYGAVSEADLRPVRAAAAAREDMKKLHDKELAELKADGEKRFSDENAIRIEKEKLLAAEQAKVAELTAQLEAERVANAKASEAAAAEKAELVAQLEAERATSAKASEAAAAEKTELVAQLETERATSAKASEAAAAEKTELVAQLEAERAASAKASEAAAAEKAELIAQLEAAKAAAEKAPEAPAEKQ